MLSNVCLESARRGEAMARFRYVREFDYSVFFIVSNRALEFVDSVTSSNAD